MFGASTVIPMMYTECFGGVEKKAYRSVAYIMLAGPHERTLEEAISNLDEMLKLDAEFAVFAVFSPYPGTDSFADGAKKDSILQIAGTD